MAKKPVIKFTANFERNLEEIERFLTSVEAPQAYDGLLDELLETVIPNLERFPGMGRPFMARFTCWRFGTSGNSHSTLKGIGGINHDAIPSFTVAPVN